MGLRQLPDDQLRTLTQQWPCREQQLKQLSVLLSPALPLPSTVVVYGPHATGKSGITASVLRAGGLAHAVVRCQECVTGRHLLQRTVAAVSEVRRGGGDVDSHAVGDDIGYTGRCENVSALAVHLELLLANRDKFVVVFDGVDKQREAPPTLLPALARLGEMVPQLTTVLIVQYPAPRVLHQTGVPHVHFPAYARNPSIHIIAQHPPDIFLEPPPEELDYDESVHDEDKAWLWPRFCAAVWDALAQNAARDLVAFRDVCHKLWRPFVAPIIRGDFGTRDFSRLLIAQRRLFQDESVLLDSIVSAPTTAVRAQTLHGVDLPYVAKWLLVAAYLASFNPARMDALYFMKATERKRRKKGGGTARSGVGRPSQHRKLSRHLLAPSAFTLDRLLSILHAILPYDFRSTIDVYTQIATLTRLKLLGRGGGIGSSDPLEPGSKWRLAPTVSWEYVQTLARDVDFGLLDYVAE